MKYLRFAGAFCIGFFIVVGANFAQGNISGWAKLLTEIVLLATGGGAITYLILEYRNWRQQ